MRRVAAPARKLVVVAGIPADESQSRLDQTEIAQPAIFALQVGLAALWRSWGIVPDAVIGHSVGEVAAAHVSGALSAERCGGGHLPPWAPHAAREQAKAKWPRSSFPRQKRSESVAEVSRPAGRRGCQQSDYNGSLRRFRCFERGHSILLEQRNVVSHMLPVNYAFHSPQMEPCRIELVHALKGLKARATSIPMISTVTGEVVQDGSLNATYWGRNVREPVRFADAV